MVVVGLGPGDPRLVSVAALDAIGDMAVRFVRTTHHPSASLVSPATSFDPLYDLAESLEEVYSGIVERLVTAAREHGRVLYAVPGSPLVAERSVELVRSDDRVQVDIVPALSFVDLVWARLGVDPLACGVRLIDGHRFATEAAGERGPLLVAQCDSRYVLSEVKLAVELVGPQVTVLQRLGLEGESVFTLRWDELDRQVVADHLTSLWIPALEAPVAAELVRFAELVRTLRQSCPWDRKQTHQSLTRHVVEEAYEVVDAIDALSDDPDSYLHLEEELGDLLFQVAFHATLAGEAGAFNLADVARHVHDKLVRRHPHVFAGAEMGDWEEIKRAEKGRSSVMEGIPKDLPALLLADQVQRKAAGGTKPVGGTKPAGGSSGMEGAWAAAAGGSVGEELFGIVARARALGVDPEADLRRVTRRFLEDFRAEEHRGR